MSRIQKKHRPPEIRLPAPKKDLERVLRRQMAWAAGTQRFQHRDPLYHVTESFRQTFDAIGRKHAAQLAEDEQTGEGGEREARRGEGDMPDPVSARAFYERPREQDSLMRFSETAFQRGLLSAAVLRGTGRMMLFSCLKKTAGQSRPVREQQRRLFENASQRRNVPGHFPDKAVFNRGFTNSAIALVVDTLRDAQRTVEDLQDLVRGGLNLTESGSYGADTLRAMYPFLDDSRERELLETYEAQLAGASGPLGDDAKALLHSSVVRTRALIGKKAQMRTEFVSKLRFISDRANEALAEFEEPGFAEGLDEALREALGPDGPSDGEGSADNGAAESEPDAPDPGTDPEGAEDTKS